MFWRVLLSGLAVALVRAALQLLRGSEYGDWPFIALFSMKAGGGFSATSFSSIASAYVMTSGLVANSVLSDYREAERLLDAARTSLNEYMDEVLLAAPGGDRGVPAGGKVAYVDLDAVTSRVVSFVHAWCESLSLPAPQSDAKYRAAHAHVDEAVRNASLLPPALQGFARNTVRIASSFRNQISRVQTIRTTCVLAPIQRLAALLLALVLLSIVVTDTFVAHAPLADFVVAAVSASASIMTSTLSLALDDPFSTPLHNTGVQIFVFKMLSVFTGGDPVASPATRRRRTKKHGGGGSTNKASDVGESTEDEDGDSAEAPAASSKSRKASPLLLFQRELEVMQITPAPLIAALRRRMRQLRR